MSSTAKLPATSAKPPKAGSQADQGARLLWSLYNTLARQLEKNDEHSLTLSRALQVQKQRLDILEKIVAGLREELRKHETPVRFFCIVCGHEFNVPEVEARQLEFLGLCPVCHNWALPAPGRLLRSSKQVANELSCSREWVAKKARENGWGLRWGKGNGTGSYCYFSQEEFEQLRQLAQDGRRSLAREKVRRIDRAGGVLCGTQEIGLPCQGYTA